MPRSLFARKGDSRDNRSGPQRCVNTDEGLTYSLDLTKELAVANSTPRPPFMPSIVEMRPGEDYDRYLWRRRKVWEREKADWLRAGNMGQARDSDGNPLYRINDRGQWARTRRMSSRTRRAVLERDGHKCVDCGSAKFLEIDHVVRYIDGGSDDLENLRVLCESCHRKRGGRA